MSYSTATPPKLLIASLENTAPNIWTYSNTDAASTVYAANYFTNAQALGMKVGDLLLYLKTDTPALYALVCLTVASTGTTFGSTLLTMS